MPPAREMVGVGEGDIRGNGDVALVVGDDLDTIVLPGADAGVGGTGVGAGSWYATVLVVVVRGRGRRRT